jgi:hypothetical protein
MGTQLGESGYKLNSYCSNDAKQHVSMRLLWKDGHKKHQKKQKLASMIFVSFCVFRGNQSSDSSSGIRPDSADMCVEEVSPNKQPRFSRAKYRPLKSHNRLRRRAQPLKLAAHQATLVPRTGHA